LPNQKTAINYSLKNLFSVEAESDRDIRVNLCLIDPVPGNSVLGVPYVEWYDKRFFKFPRIVNNARIDICENEDSACFDCLIPTAEDQACTTVSKYNIPGHHGTPTGNPFGNFGEALSSLGVTRPNATAEHVQIITLYEHYDFLSMNGTRFKPVVEDCPLADIYNQYHAADPRERARLRLQTYDQIKENQDAYKALNRTVYIAGFHESFTSPYESTTETRPVLQSNTSNTGYAKSSRLAVHLPFKSEYFVNENHVQLFLAHTIGLEAELPRHQQLVNLIERLHAEYSIYGLNQGLRDTATKERAEKGIQSLVSTLVQSYLINGLTSEIRRETLSAISRSLTLSQNSADESGALSPLESLKRNLQMNMKDHLLGQIEQQVKAHHDDLETLVRTMHLPPVEDDNPVAFIHEAFAKYQQFHALEIHLQELRDSIAHNQTHDITSLLTAIDQKLQTLRDYRTIITHFCAKTMVSKNVSMSTMRNCLDSEHPDTGSFSAEAEASYNGASDEVPRLHFLNQVLQQEIAEKDKRIERLRAIVTSQQDNVSRNKETIKQWNRTISKNRVDIERLQQTIVINQETIATHEGTIREQGFALGTYEHSAIEFMERQRNLHERYIRCQVLGFNGSACKLSVVLLLSLVQPR